MVKKNIYPLPHLPQQILILELCNNWYIRLRLELKHSLQKKNTTWIANLFSLHARQNVSGTEKSVKLDRLQYLNAAWLPPPHSNSMDVNNTIHHICDNRHRYVTLGITGANTSDEGSNGYNEQIWKIKT